MLAANHHLGHLPALPPKKEEFGQRVSCNGNCPLHSVADSWCQHPHEYANADFSVTCGGLLYLKKEEKKAWAPDPLRHGLLYLASGTCQILLDGKSIPVHPGSIFFLAQQTAFQVRNTCTAPVAMYFILYVGTKVQDIIGEPCLDHPGPYQMPNLLAMHAIFQQLHETSKMQRQMQTAEQSTLLRQLIKLIITLARSNINKSAPDITLCQSTYERCRKYIEENYPKLQSVDDIAKSCGLSKGHLSRIFKLYAKESPWNMALGLKMRLAGEILMQNQHIMIKDLTEKVGFEDVFHFSRTFKKYYGLSPKNFQAVNRIASKNQTAT